MISDLVSNEDKHKPYSDEALRKILQQQGIEIARRTVTKYRKALKILSAHQRKQ